MRADALSVPSYARIVGCAIEFHPEVVTAHAGLTGGTVGGSGVGDADARTVCGFRHDDVGQYADRYHTNDMALDLREYR